MSGLLERLQEALAGRYVPERELGEGGMAFVYAAHDLRNDRTVAIKVLKPEVAASIGPDRFLSEIRIEARLRHPHILPLFESDTADGLLFYVMQYVEGESLRDRLRREVQLHIPDALHIARQVADALDYAHSRDIVHRDIKPENILLAGDHAFVVDFGIARAAHVAGGDWRTTSGTTVWRTDTGLVVGTLGYMSPEQATAAKQLDGRSDQYSLACVVYEMLGGNGERPFTGDTLQIIVAKMMTLPPPSVRVIRETVPSLMDDALRRALAKSPADRFRVCGDFVAALGRRPSFLDRVKDLLGTRMARNAAVAAAAVVALAILMSRGAGSNGGTEADTTVYALLPFEYETGAEPVPGEARRLHDAFARWEGVGLVDPTRIEEALGEDRPRYPLARAAEVAREVGAGRYVRVAVSPLGTDSLRVSGSLYGGGARGPPLYTHTIRFSRSHADADSAYEALADHLLLREPPPDGVPSPVVTRSLPAVQSFRRGQHALEVWDLAEADSGFATAARIDGDYAHAHLWLAVVRSWTSSDPARWRIAAEQAALGRQRLPGLERFLADALLAHTHGDLKRACDLWREHSRIAPDTYTGWYGWAQCQARDTVVVADPVSPSGWSFRSSYHQMLLAYERAFALLPSILEAHRGSALDTLHAVFFTRGNAQRWGRAVSPDTATFTAYPSWRGDSLAFVPFPTLRGRAQQSEADLAAWNQAIRHQRLRFREVALTWAGAAPHSSSALRALAASLAMLGDASALDTLQRARAFVTGHSERLGIAGDDIWMRVAFGLPFHEDRLRRAVELADSLLGHEPPGKTDHPRLLASLAVLRGRAMTGAAYMRDARVAKDLDVPPWLGETAPPLLLYSAIGGPMDTLLDLERAVTLAIQRTVDPAHRDAAIYQWVGRPASLAFPAHRFEQLWTLSEPQRSSLLRMQLALATGDTAAVQRWLGERREARRLISPEILTMDVLYPEAELIAAIGDPGSAAEWLDRTLSVLPRKALRELTDPVRAAALVRALVLRARLAGELGDHDGAAKWAAAVTTLWSDADPFLYPLVDRLTIRARRAR